MINTRSLEQQKIEEDLRMKEIMGRREIFKPDEKVFKFRQSTMFKNFLSQYVFPSISHYPKSFNTRDTRGEQPAEGDISFTQANNTSFTQQQASPFIKPVSHIKQNVSKTLACTCPESEVFNALRVGCLGPGGTK